MPEKGLSNNGKSKLILSRMKRYLKDIEEDGVDIGEAGVDHIFNSSLVVIQSAVEGFMFADKPAVSKTIHSSELIIDHIKKLRDQKKVKIDKEHGRALVLRLISIVEKKFGESSRETMKNYWETTSSDLPFMLSMVEGAAWDPFKGISFKEKVSHLVKRY